MRRALLLPILCACGATSEGGVEEGPACEAAVDLADRPDLTARGLSDDLLDASGVCRASRPLNGRELVVRYTAAVSGVYRFEAEDSQGHFYRLAEDCETPVTCASTASPARALAFHLAAGEEALLALDTPEERHVTLVQVRVVPPSGAAAVPRVAKATVTAGDGQVGVVVQYEGDTAGRIVALPPVIALVGDVRVPLTAVRSAGGGLTSAAGVAPGAATPGDTVSVRLVDDRDAAWSTRAVEARVGGPARVTFKDFCAAGLWTCDGTSNCVDAAFLSPADPGAIKSCERR